MNNIKDNISNIEGCLADIHDNNNLLDLLINNYFDKSNLSKTDKLGLVIDYEFYQSLVYIISKTLKHVVANLQNEIIKIYQEYRKGK